MKWLKKFNESITSDYYNLIDEDEFYEIHFIEVDKKYFQKLKGKKTNHSLKYVRDPESDEQQMIIVGETPKKWKRVELKFKSQSERQRFMSQNPECLLKFEIYEMEDEWFVVCILNVETFVYNYYKCDQWEAVIQLLKDKNIIEND